MYGTVSNLIHAAVYIEIIQINYPVFHLSALPVLLEEYLVEAVLDGGKVEVGLREDDALGGGVDVEAVLAEHVVPHGFLKIFDLTDSFSSFKLRSNNRDTLETIYEVPIIYLSLLKSTFISSFTC